MFGPANRVIELGARERCFTGGLRRAIQLGDRHCQWPGCTEPGTRCEIDHVRRYTDGGSTTQGNGRLLCRFHNRLRERHPHLTPPEWLQPASRADADVDENRRRCRPPAEATADQFARA